MAQSRKHHYLPQFYLRGFSNNGKSIFQIEKRGGRGYHCPIRDAAEIRDYHKLDYDGAKDPYAVENQLAKVEGQLAEALTHVIESGIDTDVAHARLVEFVSLMRLRVPAFKQFVEKFFGQVVLSSGKILEHKGKLPPAPKGLENIFARDGVSISILNWICLHFMFKQAFDQNTLKLLASMTPSILRVPEGTSLLTCDQPVALFHPDANPTDPYGVGFAHRAIQVSIPLCRGALLLLTWDKTAARERMLTSPEVDEFNRRTVVMADTFVFAPEESELLVATVVRYSHCWAGFNLQVLDGGDSAFHLSRFRPVMTADRYHASV
ncbi:MAG TPA: DUF4238 domain-containing protein [Sedimentisphaerales bacterium]|nr:DUF4238 domain-containing protein [Sedimentisphaerales bacterium]